MHDFPRPAPPIPLPDLVESGFWRHSFYQPVDYLWQATMFQPVGGMDRIVTAFERELSKNFGDIVELNSEVTAIRLVDGGVVVEYVHGGESRTLTADYCVSSIPLPVLRRLPTNFSTDFRDAIKAVDFANTCKVGWQAEERFWENDTDQIYGGISWTNHPITQVWYPSNDYFSATGTVTGAYNFTDVAEKFGDLAPSERLAQARAGAADLHPGFADESIVPTAKGVTIAWQKVPHQLGGWAGWDSKDPVHMAAYKQLLQPEGDGRFYVLGDQSSPLPGWQEGAMMSAHYVIGQIQGIIPLTVPEAVRVPDSVALTQGSR
ncbi:flavin monoamine oxidase family protein [Parafrankia elaeagni]|uniref:flavin monoamine oxidase family protein n=1 Tax=Parafrankia elaeagni TaxID=222534 RepID=UPI00037097EC|nr:FAD-dependent oxidoreductase [Parafrankia elaeagni]